MQSANLCLRCAGLNTIFKASKSLQIVWAIPRIFDIASLEGNWYQELRIRVWKANARSHDTNDLSINAINAQRFADGSRVPCEVLLPVPVTKHNYLIAPVDRVFT